MRSDSLWLRLTWALTTAVAFGALLTQLIVGEAPDLGSGAVADQVRDLLWFCLLCGVSAFATIEIIKRLTSVRGHIQLALAGEWLMTRLRVDDAKRLPYRAPLDELRDAVGTRGSWPRDRKDPAPERMSSDLERVFNLQTEQAVAQVSRAGDRALADPKRFQSLLIGLMQDVPRSLSRNEGDRERENSFHDAQRVAAGVDQLQIVLGEHWRRLAQGTAVWMSGAYGLGFAWAVGVTESALLYYELGALVIGGMLAWVVRDLYAVIERLRRA